MIGLPLSPMRPTAMPKASAKMSDLEDVVRCAIACTIDSGTACSRISSQLCGCVVTAGAPTAGGSCTPTPGLARFTAASPTTSASAVTTSK